MPDTSGFDVVIEHPEDSDYTIGLFKVGGGRWGATYVDEDWGYSLYVDGYALLKEDTFTVSGSATHASVLNLLIHTLPDPKSIGFEDRIKVTAERLTEVLHGDWWMKKIDTETLEMSDENNCIVAQIFGTWHTGKQILEDLGMDVTSDGYLLEGNSDRETGAWIEYINNNV